MDEIILTGLQFWGFHGCLSSEREHGQLFIVDVNLKLSLKNAGVSDDLKDTLDYTQVAETVREIVEGEPKNLIESVAERIAGEILSRFIKVAETTVTVHKPHAPLGGIAKDIVVKVTRRR